MEGDDLKVKAISVFEEKFGCKPTHAAKAPGRVNLIGEHIDYCDGFVLPIAIGLCTIIVGRRNSTTTCNVYSNEMKETVQFDINNIDNKVHSWANYIKGVVVNFKGVVAFDAVVVSNVPIGSGLSSSAAFEVATFTFLEELTGIKEKVNIAKALACQKAEREFVGVNCGIMDQSISIMGKRGNALLLDCKTLEATQIALRDSNVAFLVTDSNAPHKLVGSEYSVRRNQTVEVLRALQKKYPQIKSYRDATLSHLESIKENLEDVLYRRGRHVITEIWRTVEAAKMLELGDYNAFGQLMIQSHNSLRNDFEVSTVELDHLVEICSKSEGVFGSRLTGAGLGGSIVTLVKKSSLDDVIHKIHVEYKHKKAVCFVAFPENGCQAVSV